MTKRNPLIEQYMTPANDKLSVLVTDALATYREWSMSEDDLEESILAGVSQRALAANTVDASTPEELASQLELQQRFKAAIKTGARDLNALMDDLFANPNRDEAPKTGLDAVMDDLFSPLVKGE